MSVTDTVRAMNRELLRQVTNLKAFLESASEVFLFQNDYDPESDDGLGDYNECDYDGYARIDTTDKWNDPVLGENGLYSILSDELIWVPPASGMQDVHGVVVVGDYGNYDLDPTVATRLLTPRIDWAPGQGNLQLTLELKMWDAKLLVARALE